jgi:hypothetical protein
MSPHLTLLDLITVIGLMFGKGYKFKKFEVGIISRTLKRKTRQETNLKLHWAPVLPMLIYGSETRI